MIAYGEGESLDLQGVLDGRDGTRDRGEVLYCVVDRQRAIWYIGMTTQPVADRFRNRAREDSAIGRALGTRNLSGWRLDVYPLGAAKARPEWKALLANARTVKQAERLLIKALQPPLNRAHTKRQGQTRRRVRKETKWGFGRWFRHMVTGE